MITFSPGWVDESLNPISYREKQALTSHLDSIKHKEFSTAFDTHYISSFFKIKQLQVKQQYAHICPVR